MAKAVLKIIWWFVIELNVHQPFIPAMLVLVFIQENETLYKIIQERYSRDGHAVQW